MKNILTKIEFHYTFLLVALSLILTGHFPNLIIFTSLIIIHELGHFLTATTLKYKVEKITIYPYGGITKLNTLVNTKIEKDLLIAVSGIIVQSIYYITIKQIYLMGFIREYIYNLFTLYHYSMLIFNLLPILPLDGSKIVNLILSKYLNFNLANRLTVILSFITIIIILLGRYYEGNYSFILIIGVLLKNIYKFYSEISYIYNKFLLERYLYNINYKKKIIINDKNKMHKNKTHIINRRGEIIPEKTYLNKIFNKKT